MAKQKGLGKGLGALLGEESLRADTPAEGAVSTLPLQKIEPNPLQPRKTFAEEELDALAESIRIHGIIQPLTVRLLPNGYYQIIAGRAAVACGKAGRGFRRCRWWYRSGRPQGDGAGADRKFTARRSQPD